MENEASFDLSICRLLQEYPLYHYRVRTGDRFLLSVLLIGRGKNFETLRNKILSNGQLLDTDLVVTVVTENADAALKALHDQAPDLKRFIALPGAEDAVEMPCGALRFQEHPAIENNLQAIIQQHAARYVVIGLDTDADAPKSISPLPGQMIAWIKGDSIQVCGQDKELFLPTRDDRAMAEILDIAYRLHYAYEKGNDPHITNQEIRASFKDPYNYRSNIECALHVRSKIASAGIDSSSLNSAADAFAKKMAEDARNNGDLLEHLAQLEHRRWCVSKAAGGRRCDRETVDLIYGDDGSTTHSADIASKWHVALVPYGKDGKLFRRLSEQDWTAEDPEAIDDLDELDKQTLRVHRRCAQITRDKLRRSLAHVEKLKSQVPGELHVHVDQMKHALEQMLEGSRDAVFVYRYHRRNLEAHLSAGADAAKEILKALKQDMGAPIEYLTRKDYKKQNLVLVGCIPFALCGWKSTVLVKLMAESVHECVAAAWQLEPGHIVFVDTAETLDEMKHLSRKARQIDRFLSRNCNQVTSSYHIFVPENVKCNHDTSGVFLLQDLRSIDPTFFDISDWHLYHCPSLETEDLRPRFVDLMYEYGATAIDMTGGKPVLISLADGYARNNRASAFFIRDNRIRNFCGARGMEWQALDKGLSVQQLFDQTDAQLIKRDDEQITGVFFRHYEALWEIAHRYAPIWYNFCLCFAKAFRDKASSPHPDADLRVPDEKLRKYFADKFRMAGELRELRTEFEAIVQDLLSAGLLTYNSGEKFYQAACEEVVACLRNSGKILEYYICCTIKEHPDAFPDAAMSWMFRHGGHSDAAKNEVDVICTGQNSTLFISAKNVTPSSLDKNNFLNYICYEVGWLADRFGGASPRTILAAPNVAQFEDGRRSRLVQKAMSRGVYLLGDWCFEPGNLNQVLINIDRGREDWCEFLLDRAAPACV